MLLLYFPLDVKAMEVHSTFWLVGAISFSWDQKVCRDSYYPERLNVCFSFNYYWGGTFLRGHYLLESSATCFFVSCQRNGKDPSIFSCFVISSTFDIIFSSMLRVQQLPSHKTWGPLLILFIYWNSLKCLLCNCFSKCFILIKGVIQSFHFKCISFFAYIWITHLMNFPDTLLRHFQRSKYAFQNNPLLNRGISKDAIFFFQNSLVHYRAFFEDFM